MLVLGNQHYVVVNQQYARLGIQTLKKPVGVLVAMIKKTSKMREQGREKRGGTTIATFFASNFL